MSAIQYPFIDIAVHENVRDHFVAGEAVVLFSPDMQSPLWANGAGARLFGFQSIYDFLDQGPNPLDVAFRQIGAAARQLASTGDVRHVTIRVASGFQRVAVQATCELIDIQGKATVLFTAGVESGRLTERARAARMIEGFDDPETHMAVLDQDGEVVAASGEFETLAIPVEARKMLAAAARAEAGRPVKRPIATVKGYLPAAIGMPSEEPALFLLFTVDTTGQGAAAPSTSEEAEESASRAAPADGFTAAIDAVANIEETSDPDEEIAPIVDEPFASGLAQDTEADISEPATAEMETTDEGVVEAVGPVPVPVEPAAEAGGPTEDVAGFVFRRDARAVRFVWKIDGDGRFTEVSKEFAAAVGPHAADVIGMAFSDLAALFYLDPDSKIAELLKKRDTWSGKTIWWPVEGTSLVVPVDLAALPTYTRNREFDGFRGFGIVRIADAAEDAHAVGLSLIPGVEPDFSYEGSDGEPSQVGDEARQTPASENERLETAEVIAGHGSEERQSPVESAELEADAPEAEVTPPTLDNDVGSENPVEGIDGNIGQTDTSSSEQIAGDEAAGELDWPAGERPALRLVPTAGRRYSDKVIQLEERRSRLSPGEQAAFREIARQLDRFIGRDDQPLADAPHAGPSESQLDSAPAEIEPTGSEAYPSGVEAETNDTGSSAPEAAGTDGGTEKADAEQRESLEAPTDVSEAAEEPAADAQAGRYEEGDAVPRDKAPDAIDMADGEPLSVEHAHASGEETETDLSAELSERELLSRMIPIRERIGLSAEIVDQMPVALLVHTGDRLIHGNPEFLKLTGYQTLDELADVGGLDALLQRQDLDDKRAEASGMVVVRADDEVIPVTARLQSVRWDDATALMLALMPAASSNTQSERPDAEVVALQPVRQADQLARLQVEVEELRAILETATDGVVIIDDKGDIRSMNRAASGLFNYDNEEINGKPFVVLFAHESQKAILDYLAGLTGHGVASVLNDGREVIGREASGGFLPLFMTIGRLTSSNGFCAVIRDITQWKRTEEELRTAKRAAETANAHKSEFLAHVSHEIRTPLNAIIGFADMMASERFGPIGHPRYIEYSNDINRSGRHVLDIVNDLLDISKIEAGEMELDFVAVGLNESVSEAVSLVQPQANNQRVIIRTSLSQGVPPVVADVRSIKQIVLNILSNAIRFTPSGGQIVVSTAYEANGTVVLRIRDTGIGMTRSELELAMKPFRQVAGTARKRGDGTGLGLPLTKAMTDANRASFAISSTPNEGTLVEITFPPQRVLAN
jgi:PAS domain S-box-containing protein